MKLLLFRIFGQIQNRECIYDILTVEESQSASQKIPELYLLTLSSLLLCDSMCNASCQLVQNVQFLPLKKKLLLHFVKKPGPVDMLICTVPMAHTCYPMYVFHLQVIELLLQISSVIPSVPTRLAVTTSPLKYICSGKWVVSRLWRFLFKILP